MRIAAKNDSRQMEEMTVSDPFEITIEDLKRAQLDAGALGMWCVIVDGCYHLFQGEAHARKARDMMDRGAMVR